MRSDALLVPTFSLYGPTFATIIYFRPYITLTGDVNFLRSCRKLAVKMATGAKRLDHLTDFLSIWRKQLLEASRPPDLKRICHGIRVAGYTGPTATKRSPILLNIIVIIHYLLHGYYLSFRTDTRRECNVTIDQCIHSARCVLFLPALPH